MTDTAIKARGKWQNIIPVLTGISPSFLDGKHHACPVTGEKGSGTGRFRFSNKDGRGSYFCACSDGREDGFGLLKCQNGWDFKDACKEVDRVIGNVEYDKTTNKKADSARALKTINRIIKDSRVAGDEVRGYLASRGIQSVPGSIRQVRTSYGIDRELEAMVVRIRNPKGEMESLHLTYLEGHQKANIETPRIVMTPVGTIKGGAARLSLVQHGILGVAEGIETALSAQFLHKIPTWAAISSGGIESFDVPEDVKHLTIFADWDAKFGGQKAAYALAHRLAVRKRPVPIGINICIPEQRPGCGGSMDWNDVLMREIEKHGH